MFFDTIFRTFQPNRRQIPALKWAGNALRDPKMFRAEHCAARVQDARNLQQ
jgi:hypothetical protein